MNVYVTGFPASKKIQAIKGIRAATGLDLKGSKDVADKAAEGERVKVALRDIDAEAVLAEHGVSFERVPNQISLESLMDILAFYPAEMPVGDVIRVLRATDAHTPEVPS
jgi:hypothetical protein